MTVSRNNYLNVDISIDGTQIEHERTSKYLCTALKNGIRTMQPKLVY